MKPSRLVCPADGASTAETFTSGLPALAITNGSPLAACSTSLDRCVLASLSDQTKFNWFSLPQTASRRHRRKDGSRKRYLGRDDCPSIPGRPN
jgi:hypothetical protein